MVKVEGIYKGFRRIGQEALLDEKGLELLFSNGSKERFFDKIDEEIDLAVFLHHVNWAHTHNLQGYTFVNIKPSTLIKHHEDIMANLKGKIVLELREDFITDKDLLRLKEIREEYKFLLSLDDVGKGASNIDRIKALKPNFVKVEVQLFDNAKTLFGFVSLLRDIHNCHLIAEKVENDKHFRMIRGAGIEMWQGYYEKLVEEGKCTTQSLQTS